MGNNVYTLFKGKDAAIEAYEYNQVPNWALFVGKDPMFSYEGGNVTEGAQKLDQVLDSLIANDMEGTLQLRIYRSVPSGGLVNSTPFNFSFKFQLYGDDQYEARNPMHRRLKAIQEKIDQLEKEKEEPEEDTSLQGQIAGILRDPDTRKMILTGIIGWVRNTFSKHVGPATMAGTDMQNEQQGVTPDQLYARLSPEEQLKLNQATYILMSLDPSVGTNLLKLAQLLQTKPDTYAMLTKMSI